jgi:cytidylate kinase
MTASVVTFSSQMGSGGGAIARAVAGRLRFRYYDWEVIARAAQEAGVSPEVLAVATSERSPGFLERMMSRLAGSAAGEEPLEGPAPARPNLLTSADYRQFLEHVVQELGRKGDAVILDHSGQVVLKRTPGVLKVLIRGSEERRVARMAANQGANPDAVRKTIANSDRQRQDYFKSVYHLDWLSAANYDLVISTDYVNHDLAVDMITAAAREMP